ncbi:MAG TPA: SRPBCC domain-containing protein [Chryseosolibacter sp.]
MERKTKISAEPDRHDLVITREFDLPLDLLFRAYEDADIYEQWMGSKVLKLENRKHGGWQLQKKDADGNVVFAAHGTIHDFVHNSLIVRTFQMENTPFPAQLEFLEFEKLTDNTSKLTMQIVYRSVAMRDQMLKLPFAQGMNMAHDLLQNILNTFKK